jgi:hypothetical protein
VKILEEKMIYITKANSQLEKETRTTRNDNKALEKINKEQQIRIESMTSLAHQSNLKFLATKAKMKEILKQLFMLNAYF